MIKKIISLVILVLVISVVIIFAKKNPTTNLISPQVPVFNEAPYVNKNFGFTISYPSGWRIANLDEGKGSFDLFNFSDFNDSKELSPNQNKISVYVEPTASVFGENNSHSSVLPLKDNKGYMIFVIFGNPDNFYILDEIVRRVVITGDPVFSTGKTRYTNEEFGFSFLIPKGWYVSDFNLTSSFIQLFNYDLGKADGKSIFPPGHNKIEMIVMNESEVANTAGSDEDASRYEVRNVPLAGGKKVLHIVMYGDKNNFYILDEFVKTIKTN